MEERRSLLVVEDDDDINLLVCRALRRVAPGWEVRRATNGSKAQRELLRDPRPCLLVTDLDMPVMNGFQLIEWARTVPELTSLRIVVFSGCAESTAQKRCEILRVDDFVAKSLTLDTLSSRINAILPLPGSATTAKNL